jgi:outer membrane protein insertion porin family
MRVLMMRWLKVVCGGRVLAVAAGLCVLTTSAIAAGQPAPADAIVEAVNIQQNRYIPKDTLLYYISTKPGERYDENRLRADFKRLWETGFVDDVLLDVRDGKRGKIVTFVVREKRRIALVDYRGSKAVTTSNIEDKLKEKEAKLPLDSFFDLGKVRRVESIIRDMLMEAGRPFGTVRHETKPVGGAGLQVSFVIDDGAKTRVGDIRFVGNKVFSSGKLRGSMKKIRQRGFWNLAWLRGATYTEERWREDHTKIEDYYRSRGYATATIGEPVVSYYDGVCGTFRRRPCKNVRLEIAVSEGERYRVGQIKIEGMKVFRDEAVRRLVRLRTGDVYNGSRIKKAYEKLRDWYGAQGYFNWTPQTDTRPDTEKHIVDVTLNMQEDKRFYVGRIRIVGNDSTRDKVVRREVYIEEGGVFNTEALKMSVKRINQLGYFKPIEDFPEMEASALGDDKVDVTIKVKEQNRNQFSVGGGVSGYDGTFANELPWRRRDAGDRGAERSPQQELPALSQRALLPGQADQRGDRGPSPPEHVLAWLHYKRRGPGLQ